jgi:hypothetical protein
MSTLKLFLQFEGHRPVELIQVPDDAHPGAVLAAAAALGANVEDAFVFGGDNDDNTLNSKKSLVRQGVANKSRVHVHRCKKIRAFLNYADEDPRHHDFSPSTTVDEVKEWYVDKLKMSPVDATEHVLQITDTTDRPDPDVQIGALVSGRCDVNFTLVPIKRVEG